MAACIFGPPSTPLITALLASLVGCAAPRPPALEQLETRIEAAGRDRPRTFMIEGLEHLADGDLDAAGRAFALGLDADPRNPHLNFLSGFVYDLRAVEGATDTAELAEVGYRLALRFDPDHWLAA
ncbi:MAG: hypothetical protein KC620_16095, partial [Myxococcales bacterium]|nr:hypothetical protein [Myxococcales bacterium]